MGKRVRKYRYDIGDKITNNFSTIIILNKTRKGKNNVKAYEYLCEQCNN